MSAVEVTSAPEQVCITPYEFTEFAIQHKGQPISLARRPWLADVYNSPVSYRASDTLRRKVLLIFGRQCEKSTTIGNTFISMANLVPYLRLLYITASNTQMREFSDERLRAVIADSPTLKHLTGREIRGGQETQNVQTKRFLNQSKMVLRSVYRNADRVRGISADVLGVDELQDILTDNLPVIEETLFHCEQPQGPVSIYAGTPKTFDNPLEYYWRKYSSRNEWMTKCEGCNYWNMIEEECITPTGLACRKCGKPINPADGKAQWVRWGAADSEWEGFRLPQPVVPYAYYDRPEMFALKWKGLLAKPKRYPRPRFYNEVMARSYDAGTKPVTEEELRACCDPSLHFIADPYTHKSDGSIVWAGVDWGSGEKSYTVLSLWKYTTGGAFTCIYAKKYEGLESDPDHSIQDIIKICRIQRVRRIGADWGFGFYSNDVLKKAFGLKKVVLYQHAGNQKEKVSWDKSAGKFTTHRSRVLQDVFTLIKRKQIRLPVWGESESFCADILAVYSEYSEHRRQLVFNHPVSSPDDFLHTACYALLVSQLDKRRPDLQSPGMRLV